MNRIIMTINAWGPDSENHSKGMDEKAEYVIEVTELVSDREEFKSKPL
jgi:hypothetical protein